MKTLTILIDFAKKIWNSSVAMKQSENPIKSMIQHSFGKFFLWNSFYKWVKFPRDLRSLVWTRGLTVFASSLIVRKVCSSEVEISRSSHPKVFLRKGVRKTCSKFTWEHPWRSAILLMLKSNFIEIALRHGCSPLNLLHIFRTPFPRNTSGWLLLD